MIQQQEDDMLNVGEGLPEFSRGGSFMRDSKSFIVPNTKANKIPQRELINFDGKKDAQLAEGPPGDGESEEESFENA